MVPPWSEFSRSSNPFGAFEAGRGPGSRSVAKGRPGTPGGVRYSGCRLAWISAMALEVIWVVEEASGDVRIARQFCANRLLLGVVPSSASLPAQPSGEWA
jgi:hypothetical protein